MLSIYHACLIGWRSHRRRSPGLAPETSTPTSAHNRTEPSHVVRWSADTIDDPNDSVEDVSITFGETRR